MAIAFGPRTPPTPKPPEVVTYDRPADWLELPEVLETDQKFVGLAAIREGDINRIRLRAQGAFTVDWGDGTVENFASNTVASHDYDYDDVTLDGTLSTRGYKQVIVTLTPQSGQNLTLLDLGQTLTVSSSVYIQNSFLDVRLGSPNFTNLQFRGPFIPQQSMLMLEQVEIVNLGNITSTDNMFVSTLTLKSVLLFDTSSVTSMSSMFNDCSSLTSVPLFDTSSVTDMTLTFFGCSSLTSVPLFDTSSVTSMSSMFNDCSSLTSVPQFDTSSVTNMSAMFRDCSSLVSLPLFDTSSVTNMSNMFFGCSSPSLTSVPLFDTSSVTNMSNMFSGCSSLTSVPLFDTSSVTNMFNMFRNCSSLTSVPLFDTSSVTSMSSMFNDCSSLTSVPLFDTSSVTNMNNMFFGCSSLTSVPEFNLIGLIFNNNPLGSFVGGSTSTFISSISITRDINSIKIAPINHAFQINRSPRLSREAIVEVFNNLSDRTGLSSLTIHIGNNASVEPYGVAELTQTDRDIALNKNWTIVG